MAFTTASAAASLRERVIALTAERARIQTQAAEGLKNVDAQLAAIQDVLGTLADPVDAAVVDRVLSALAAAGVRLEVVS